MIRPGQTPLQITILLLVLYILHLHWTQPDSVYHTSLQPITVVPASAPVPVSSAAHTPAIPIAAPVPKKNVITLSTDKANWSKSKGGVANGIFQRPHSPQRKGMRIAIATMNTDETSYDHISLRNKFGYANKHNYALKFDLEMPKGLVPMAVWHKLNMIEYLIRTEEFDWIWWIDYDTVITNTETKLEDVILDALRSAEKADEIDFILTADCWPLNAGSMLIRSSSRVLPFLSAVWDCGDPSKSLDEPSEQDCIRDMLLKEPYSKTWGDRALWVPQTKINAFPSEVPCYDKYDKGWSPGDFVVHFAGAWAHLPQHLKKDSYGVLMRKYSEWIDKKELTGGERMQDLDKQDPHWGEEPVVLGTIPPPEKKTDTTTTDKAGVV